MHPISSHRLNVRCHFLNTFTHQCISTNVTFVNKQQILFIHWYANNLCLSCSKVLVNEVIATAKDVYQTNHTQAAEITPWQRWNGPVCCCMTLFAPTMLQCVTQQNRPLRHCRGGGTGVMKVHNVLCPRLPWLLTLTFKLVRTRDQTRLPCEFGANPLSGSRDICFTNKQTDKKSQSALKTEPYAFYCVH